MKPALLTATGLLLLGLLVLAPAAVRADEGDESTTEELVHVPVNEIDVLLQKSGKGVVISYAEYAELLAKARARARKLEAEPPSDGVLASATGTVDLRQPDAATFNLSYQVEVLADGPRAVDFPSQGVAFEGISVVPDDDGSRYEEFHGKPRLRFEGPGGRVVIVKGSARVVPQKQGRLVDVRFPAAAAMSLTLRLPPGVEGFVIGEGPLVQIPPTGPEGRELPVRPARDGRLRVAWQPASRSAEGPPIIDEQQFEVHTIGDGLVQSELVVQADVFRTPVEQLRFRVPADFAVHGVTGKGLVGFERSDDRQTLTARFAKPKLGRVGIKIDGERAFRPGTGIPVPKLRLEGAVRRRASVALRFLDDVRARDVTVDGGRRTTARRGDVQAGILRYALAGPEARIRMDVEAGDVRVRATSSYYLNLAETGKTLVATATYQVEEGTLYRLTPSFPTGFLLRDLTVNGQSQGFTQSLREDGTLEIGLARGVPKRGAVTLAATFEEAEANWVPDAPLGRGAATTSVAMVVPTAGADREEGLVAVGADGAFEVLETSTQALVSVGAGELTARGIDPAGLVYGYRLDGEDPSLALRVRRLTPVIDVEAVTTLVPSPRRLDARATVVHRVRRAGVRTLYVDVPAWTQEQVSILGAGVRSTVRLAADANPEVLGAVPAGYARWRVELDRRVIGDHVLAISYFQDQDRDDWQLDGSGALVVRAPVDSLERHLVIGRASGLEVQVAERLPEGVRSQAAGELPPEAGINPMGVYGVYALSNGAASIPFGVKKHGGAAVLDAIATRVTLATAVAEEGILRTRAEVALYNVGRQFLAVRLPPDSDLIGALVDKAPVKPLQRRDGTVLVPVPMAAHGRDRAVIAMTYETRLGSELSGRVEVPTPSFPELEVLFTEQVVAFEPARVIGDVTGDFTAQALAQPAPRWPWIARLFDGGAVADGVERPEVRGYSAQVSPIDFSTNQPNPTFATRNDNELGSKTRSNWGSDRGPQVVEGYLLITGDGENRPVDAPRIPDAETIASRRVAAAEYARILAAKSKLVGYARGDASGPEGIIGVARDREQADAALMPAKPGRGDAGRPVVRGGKARAGFEAAGSEPRPMADPQGPVAESPPEASTAASDDDPAGGPPRGGAAEGERGNGAGRAPARNAEGGVPLPGDREPDGSRRGAGRRRGLLSLDVPVLLAPNVVAARRMGGGGTLVIDLGERAAQDTPYRWTFWLFLALGLGAAWLGTRARWLYVGSTIVVAAASAVILGGEGATLTAAAADAATLLAGLWLVVAVGRKLLPKKRVASATAALLIGLVLAPSAQADEPRPPVPPVKPEKKLFVPYNPARPGEIAGTDRVYLPLDRYLELYKAAHPEADPEVVRLGRYVTLVDARYELDVSGDEAIGVFEFGLSKRGTGLKLVGLPLGGLAVTQATLDDEPVRLLLKRGRYYVPVEAVGDQTLVLRVRLPILSQGPLRRMVFQGPRFAAAHVLLRSKGFVGEVHAPGAARVERLPDLADGTYAARIRPGTLGKMEIVLAPPTSGEVSEEVVTRSDVRTVHSLRGDGTESVHAMTLHILQGKTPFLDVALPADTVLLEASGKGVQRWLPDVPEAGRVRLVFGKERQGSVRVRLRTFRSAASAVRTEALGVPRLLGATGQRGTVIVNAEASARVETTQTQGLFRTARPKDADSRGSDRAGRVVGAWTFATLPIDLQVRISDLEPRLHATSLVDCVFGDDRVRTRASIDLSVDRRTVGGVRFALPGRHEVRSVQGQDVSDWWTSGIDEERVLHVRFASLVSGRRTLLVFMEHRLGGERDGISVPRLTLEGAQRDRGRLVLWHLPDVRPDPGIVPGLESMPLSRLSRLESHVPRTEASHAFIWEETPQGRLPVILKTPPLERKAVVVSFVEPGEEEHRIEHIVLFEIARGATDRVRLFVPDAGADERTVIRTRDVREIREQRATRRDADGIDVEGTQYDILLQSRKTEIIEVTVSQWSQAGAPVRAVLPEEVSETRWFTSVRNYLDGKVAVRPTAGRPDAARFQDIPFVPAGMTRTQLVRSYVSERPFVLEVLTERHELEAQAEAVVLAALADVVLGLDGEARTRITWRVFNRSRQFLRVRLPDGARLFGATAAGAPIKPLAGAGGTILVPVPKVPLGGTGYEVSLLYRVRVGKDFADKPDATVRLPEIVDIDVDRTVVRMHVPEGYAYDFDTKMSSAEYAELAGELAAVRLREARDLLVLAENGTLDQRVASTANAQRLIADAGSLRDIAKQNNWDVRELARDIDQLSEQALSCGRRVQRDVQAARSAAIAVNPTNDEFAGNAACLIDLEDTSNDSTASTNPMVCAPGDEQLQSRGVNKAGWIFNGAQASSEEDAAPQREELTQLKDRLQRGLISRAQQDVSKRKESLEQDRATKQVIEEQRKGNYKKTPPAEKFQALDNYDANNFAELNRRVQAEQRRNNQLGANQNDQAGQVMLVDNDQTRRLRNLQQQRMYEGAYRVEQSANVGQTPGAVRQGDVLFGSPDNPQNVPFGRPQSQTIAPSTGVFFNDQTDGDFRARTENVFDFRFSAPVSRSGPDANLGRLVFGIEEVDEAPLFGGEPEEGKPGFMRTGLMGVDVELPPVGRVYYFTSLEGGGEIVVRPSELGTPFFARVLLLLATLALIGGLGFLVYRQGLRRGA